jgi:hypothetical protein
MQVDNVSLASQLPANPGQSWHERAFAEAQTDIYTHHPDIYQGFVLGQVDSIAAGQHCHIMPTLCQRLRQPGRI